MHKDSNGATNAVNVGQIVKNFPNISIVSFISWLDLYLIGTRSSVKELDTLLAALKRGKEPPNV